MQGLSERVFNFLQSQPDVSMLSDASTRNLGDGIRCSFGGVHWFIAFEPGGPSDPVEDPRKRKERPW